MRRVAVVLVAGFVSASIAVACGGNDAKTPAGAPTGARPTTTTTTAPAVVTTPLKYTRTTETFVDESRPTDDPNGTRSAPTRTLPTDIYVPDGPGPFPLIVHSHGAAGNPGKFTQLLGTWASHGYVVAAPQFPLTNDRTGPTVIGDYANQPGDVHFVLDQVLALSKQPGNALSGKVDAERIGVSGLSLGGATTYGVAFSRCCADKRVDAVVVMSGLQLPFDDQPLAFTAKPILITHGTGDTTLKFSLGTDAYAKVKPPKYFVTLDGAPHAQPYEDAPDPHDEIVQHVTTDFWDAYLRADAASIAKLRKDATVAGLSSEQDQPR